MANYVESKEISRKWADWAETGSQESWDDLCGDIYLMCEGISKKFKPKTEEEHTDLTHEAYVAIMTKIKKGKISDNGKSPVFNLLTTAIHNILYTIVQRIKRKQEQNFKYVNEQMNKLQNSIR